MIYIFFLASFAFALPENIEWHREEARMMLRNSACARCHIPPGKSKALKIFNLDNGNWSFPMTNNQLSQIKWRVDLTDDEVKAFGSDPKRRQLTKKQIEFLKRYVDRELGERKKPTVLTGHFLQ